MCEQCFSRLSSENRKGEKNHTLGSSVDTLYYRMKDYVIRVCYRPRTALKKKNKVLIAHLLVFIHGMAITRRLRVKSTYSGGAV